MEWFISIVEIAYFGEFLNCQEKTSLYQQMLYKPYNTDYAPHKSRPTNKYYYVDCEGVSAHFFAVHNQASRICQVALCHSRAERKKRQWLTTRYG